MNARRAGFTLVEILIAMAILSVVITAAFQVLQTQGDAIRFQRTTIDVQQTNRTVAGVLAAELREVSPTEGDLIVATPESLTMRLVRKLGVVCNPDTLVRELAVWQLSETFAIGDSLSVFSDGDTLRATDDTWIYASVTAVDSIDAVDQTVNAALGHEPCVAWDVHGRARLTLATIPSGVRRGAPFRSFSYFTYGVYQKNGEWVLGRHEPGDTVIPLAGPLEGAGGLRFDYLDENGTVITPSTAALRESVRRIRITVDRKSVV